MPGATKRRRAGKIDRLSFRLTNKATGQKEDVWIPFDICDSCDDLVMNTSHTLLVGTTEECYRYIERNPGVARSGFISSAYVLANGRCVLLHPHTHDAVARTVLGRILVPDTHGYGPSTGALFNSTLMPLYAGAMRVQMRPDGIGVTIDTAKPPSLEQHTAVKDYYYLTSREVFVCEVNHMAGFVKHIVSLEDWEDLLCELHSTQGRPAE